MTALAIGRWHSRYRAARPPEAASLRAWDAAPGALAMPAAADTEAILCIRRLAIAVRLREGIDGTAQFAALCDAALAAGIAAALREAGPAARDIVLWRDRREALADMLYRAAGGDLSRAWAWRQAGLLPEAAPGDAATALAAAVAALAAAPGLGWSVLARLVLAEPETGALARLLAALDHAAWRALLGEAPLPRIAAAAPVSDIGAVAPPAPPGAAAPMRPPGPGGIAMAPRDPVARAILAFARARPAEASRHRAILHRLLARAIAGGAVAAAAQEAEAAAALEALLPIAPPAARPPPPGIARAPEAAPPAPGEAEAAPPAPPLPEAMPAPLRSAWGGLLFLLPLLPASGLLAAADPLPPALHALGLALGVPAEDPALGAFCGGTLPDPAPLPETLIPDTIAALEALLGDRLGPPEDRAAWLPGLCRRDALVFVEPGWIEVEFPLDSADPRLRRGAIDLDPGHLPWLGCVVRFRYA